MKLESFVDRFKYLELSGIVGEMNAEVLRYLNQKFYHTAEWRRFRHSIIVRDGGFDLAHPDRPIAGRPIIHHINPISLKDVLDRSVSIFDPENVILVSHDTHNAIHYGIDKLILPDRFEERRPNDTCPWKD